MKIGDGYDDADAQSFPASDPPAAILDGPGSGGRPLAPAAEVPGADGGGDATDGDGDRDVPDRPHRSVPVRLDATAGLDEEVEVTLDHGHVAIAAITSCTNTSNPQVMVAAGLVARKAAARGLTRRPWVKTSLAPGSKVVVDYLDRAGLLPDLAKLGFDVVGFGCTTCIGNSGPLPPPIAAAADEHGLALVSVLSGNRNFEGRINPDVRMNYLASPPLVVAYALAGTMDVDLTTEPLGHRSRRRRRVPARPVADIIRGQRDRRGSARVLDVHAAPTATCSTATSCGAACRWPRAARTSGPTRRPTSGGPPYFDGMPDTPTPLTDIEGARALALLGDSVTTDHISPAGAIRPDGPAGRWLIDQGVAPGDFNSYGSRRGNHEVMIRGTFANVRIRNRLAPGTEGGVTVHQPSGEQMSIFDAAERYRSEGVPLVVLAGKEYGSGSSRDWAAKGTALLGVRAVVAESFERIHRSNLIGMGVLPLQIRDGATLEDLGLDGERAAGPATFADPRRRGRRPGIAARRVARGRRHARVGRPGDDPGDGPHRHPDRGRLLRARRHPPVRPPPAPGVGGTLTGRGNRFHRPEDEARVPHVEPMTSSSSRWNL